MIKVIKKLNFPKAECLGIPLLTVRLMLTFFPFIMGINFVDRDISNKVLAAEDSLLESVLRHYFSLIHLSLGENKVASSELYNRTIPFNHKLFAQQEDTYLLGTFVVPCTCELGV